jgi:hypothetical protein
METLHIAEAGTHRALWELGQFGRVEETTFTVPVGKGNAVVVAEQNPTTKILWKVKSTGKLRGAQRTVVCYVFNMSIWNMNMGLGDADSIVTSSNGTQGTTSVTGPFYARGDISLSGNSAINCGPLFVKEGTLKFLNNATSLGSEGNPVAAFIQPAIDGNAAIWDEKAQRELEPGDPGVYVDPMSYICPNITLPPLRQLEAYRDYAAQESEENVVAYPGIRNTYEPPLSGYKVLDNDTALSVGDVASRPMYTIGSRTGSFGTPGGEFAWDKDGRRLYVNGTVFVDGNLTIGDSANSEINYYGKGTIVVNGDIYINGRLRPPTYPYTMSDENVLGLVTDESIYIDITSGNSTPSQYMADLCGAFFATRKVKFLSNNVSFVGSMISGMLDFGGSNNNNHLFADGNLPNILPPNMPGGNDYITVTSSQSEINDLQ